jgi:hypothetical protein
VTLTGAAVPRRALEREEVVPFLLREATRAPDLWTQKGYLARAVSLGGEERPRDLGVVPLAHFVDESGPDAVAIAVEMDAGGRIFPGVYVRRAGRVRAHDLPPDPLHRFDGDGYRDELASLVAAR